MTEVLLKLLVMAYIVAEIFVVLNYISSIKELWLRKKMKTSFKSSLIWTFFWGITFLYSLIIFPNLLFIIISGLNFISCALILVLSISLKYRKGYVEW